MSPVHRLGALVVLYQPAPGQLQQVLRLAAQCPRLVAVDNTPQHDPAQHDMLVAAGIAVLINANRGGIGGAFNRGLAHLQARGATVAVLLDQDSDVPAGYFDRMAGVCDHLGDAAFLVGPRVFERHAGRCLRAFTFTRFGLRSVPVDDCPNTALLPCSFVISSGSAISLAAHARIGPFREEWVIDHIDSDYCLRAVAAGVPVRMSCAVTLRHQIGRLSRHRLLGLEFIASNHGAVRRYYFARNSLQLTRAHGSRWPSVALVNLLALTQLLAVLLFETDKRRKTLAVLAGWVDGLRGRLGPFEACRPRLAAWCATAC